MISKIGKMFFVQTIKGKFVLGILFFILIVQISSSLFQFYQVRSIIMKQFSKQIDAMSGQIFVDLDSKMYGYLYSGDAVKDEGFQEVVKKRIAYLQFRTFPDLVEKDEDINHLFYVNHEGKPVAAAFNAETKEKKEIDPKIVEIVKQQKLTSIILNNEIIAFAPYTFVEEADEDEEVDKNAPPKELKKIFLGGFIVSYKIDKLDDETQKIIVNSTASVLIYMLITFLCSWLFTKRVLTRRIDEIIKMIEAMAEGRLDTRFSIKQNDEICQMGKALNSYIDTLVKKVKVAENIAMGDLTVNIELASNEDALGKALKQMIIDLNNMISSINQNSNTLTTSSEQLAQLSQRINGATDQMASQSSTVAGATQEMTASVAAMAEVSDEMSNNIQSISATSTQMSQNMKLISESMGDLAKAINDVLEKSVSCTDVTSRAQVTSETAKEIMNELNKSANEIGDVTEIIKEIAQQTNLLALNANIEAASAGEAGRGFAVVANEIKELAKQSSTSAEDINKKITAIQQQTERSEHSMNEITNIVETISESSNTITEYSQKGSETVNKMVASVQESAHGVNEIAKLISNMSAMANENAKSSNELTRGSTEINHSMESLNSIISNTNKDITEVYQETQNQTEIAKTLKNLVNQFDLSEDESNTKSEEETIPKN